MQFPASSFDSDGEEQGAQGVPGAAPDTLSPEQTVEEPTSLESAADSLGEGFWEADVSGGKARFSPIFRQLLGYLPNELPEEVESLLNLAHPEDAQSLRSAFLLSHRPFSIEARLLGADGQYSAFLMRGWPDSGSPTFRQGTLARIDASAHPRDSAPEARKLLGEAIEAGVEAMLVLKAARNFAGEPVDFDILDLNSRGAKLLGVPKEEAIGRLLGDVVPSAREDGVLTRYANVLKTGVPQVEEYDSTPGGFQRFSIRQRAVPLSDGIAVFATDVSEQKRTADAADRSRRMFERIATTTPDLHGIWDLDTGRFLYTNRSLSEMLGYESTRDRLGDGFAIERLMFADDVPAFHSHLRALAARSGEEVEDVSLRFRGADGEHRWLMFRDGVFDRYSDGRPKTILMTAQDITRQKSYERDLEARMTELAGARTDLESRQQELESLNLRLADFAWKDGLTELKNRRAFEDNLTAEVERAQRYNLRLALLLADVDHFKSYNDQYGHPGGDRALKAFGAILTEVSRKSDTVARFGGEEFAIILPNTGAEEAARLAERIQASLAGTEYGMKGVTASFGCSEVSPGKEAKDRLLSEADQALYQSKSNGRNQVTVWKGE